MRGGGTQATNWKSEESILALCLMDESALHELSSYGLAADHFYDPGHREIYRGMLEDVRQGMAPDEATLLDRHMAGVGDGKPWADLMALTQQLDRLGKARPRRTNLRGHCEKVFDSSRRRDLVRACQRALALAGDDVDTDEIVREVQQASIKAHDRGAGAVDLKTMEDIARQACDRAVAVARGDEEDAVIPFGLRDLDSKFSARRGSYVLVGARPSMGKTHFLLSVAEQIARSSGPLLFCSVEMGSTAIGDRIFAHDAAGEWGDDPHAAEYSASQVMRRWEGLPIRLDTSSRSLSKICSSIRVAKQRYGIVAAMVDYLQLIRLPRGSSREQEVASASRELAALAHELDIVLFVACQLNRQLESRPLRERRPRMSDLRESGQLEQDADGILFLFREAAYNPASDTPEILEVGISKQRNGRAPRTAFCHYQPGDGYVRNLTHTDEMRATAASIQHK
jgi:replicative DNA helicase